MKNKWKKLISIIFIFILMLSFTMVIYANTDGSGELGTSGLTWTYTAADNTLVISGTGTMPDYTTSSKPPFNGKAYTNIVIEEGVSYIGKYAFYNNSNIVSVSMPEGTNIGFNAFKGTPLFEDYPSKYIVNIGKENPEDVKIEYNDYSGQARIYGIGDMQDFDANTSTGMTSRNYCLTGSLRNGYPITSVVIEEGVVNIGANAFLYKSGNALINSIEISDSVKSIGDQAFIYQTQLQTFDLKNVETVGDKTFYGNTALTTINAPNVKTIGESAFSGWYEFPRLTELNAPKLTTIGEGAFKGVSTLTSVNAPLLTSVGAEAFKNISTLTTLNAPNLISVGREAFINNNNLTSVVISDNAVIGSNAFKGTPVHSDYPSKYTINIGKVNPEDVKIEYNDYSGVARVYGSGDMQDFAIYKSKNLVGTYSNSYPITSVVIEEGVTNIGKDAFYYSSSYSPNKLTSVSIASSVKSIGDSAFEGQGSLTTITGMEGVEVIGNNAFDSTKLTTLNAPNLITIGKEAFKSNTNLTSVTIGKNPTIGLYAFEGTSFHANYPSIRTVEIGKVNPSDVIAEYNDYSEVLRIYGSGDMIDFEGPDRYNHDAANLITSRGFKGSYPVSSITIEEGVTNIGDYAFYTYYSFGISSVYIPKTVKKIGNFAFKQDGTNSYLDTITGMEGVEEIGQGAFSGCVRLRIFENKSQINQIIGVNAFDSLGSSLSSLSEEEREVYAYSVNTNFISQVQEQASRPYTITTLDEVELNPLESTLEEWLGAGNTAEDWLNAGNTVEGYLNSGGTVDSWGSALGGLGIYYWGYGGGTSGLWTTYGGTTSSWGSYGGTPTDWALLGGTASSWGDAGGSIEEYKAEVPEEPEEDKGRVDVFVDESKVSFPDTKPTVTNEEILVPVRFVMQELGFEVNWDGTNKKAVMRKTEIDGNKLEIEMRPNQASMLVNGKLYPLNASIQLVSPGRLLLPGGELVKAMQDIFYKQEKPAATVYEGYYYSEEIAGVEPKLTDIPTIEEFTDNPNLIQLTPENEESILANEVSMTDILLTVEPTNFRATVPFKVEVYMDKYGEKTIGQGYKITNECPLGQIVIVGFNVTPVSGWTLVDISDNFKTKKLNTKEFGLSVNNAVALNNEVILNTSLAEPIRNGESKDLVFDVELAGQTAEVTQVISSLSIVLDFWK